MFTRYIGIDYSGAQTPTASLKGLRVYLAKGDATPARSRRRHPRAQVLDPALADMAGIPRVIDGDSFEVHG